MMGASGHCGSVTSIEQTMRTPVMGTAQALAACAAMHCLDSNMAQRAAGWMVATQHASGGWGRRERPVD